LPGVPTLHVGDGALAEKTVVVTVRVGSASQQAIIQNVTVRRFGGREFLVGEYVLAKGTPEDWKGAELWAPVDHVECLQVFADQEKALRILEGAIVQPVVIPPKDK
jgi:hypothetical protein